MRRCPCGCGQRDWNVQRYVPAIAAIALAICLAIYLSLSPSRHELANILTWPMNTGKHGAYNFFSGIGIDSIVGLFLYWRHNNCHSRLCPYVGHKHPEHGWPVCKRHYHDTPAHV